MSSTQSGSKGAATALVTTAGGRSYTWAISPADIPARRSAARRRVGTADTFAEVRPMEGGSFHRHHYIHGLVCQQAPERSRSLSDFTPVFAHLPVFAKRA